MHVPQFKPSCFVPNGAEILPRAPWAHDQGRGCGQATDPATWAANLRDTPGCAGCARAWHAMRVRAGAVAALPQIRPAP